MDKVKAKVVVVKKIPEGLPKESDFGIEERELPELEDGQLLFQSLYISPDPYQRGAIRRLKPGDTMIGTTVAKVLESKNVHYQKGDYLVTNQGWVSHGVMNPPEIRAALRHNPEYGPPSTALGVFGMPGMTAYFGLLRICDPKPGEVLLVSGAAGAVGSLVGQIGKIKGCFVIGVAGSKEKCDWIKSLGFDAAINYKEHKTTEELKAALDNLSPTGIDCFFDNVGGSILDAALMSIKPFARVAICGQISLYNNKSLTSEQGPRLFWNLIYTNAKIEGFVVTRWLSEWPEGIKTMAAWVKEGRVKYQETIEEGGIEATPKAFISMLSGGNTGKQLVKL